MRSSLARSSAVISCALAMALCLGSGSAFAASQAPQAGTREAAPASVTFHHLSLLNGWKSSQGQYGTGNPSAGISNGVVYLSGSLHLSSGSNEHFATLPPADRPGRYLYLPIYTYGGGEGSLEISPSGAMYLFGAGDTIGYSSLAGISFPLTLTTHFLSLENGWQSADGSDSTGDPGVAISNGIVYLSGSVESGSAPAFAILPPGYRPSRTLYLPIYTLNGSEGSLRISPAGHMSLYGGATTDFSSLAGVSFPHTLTSHKLSLVNGWKSSQGQYGTGNPSAGISNGVVYLSGSLHQPSGTSTRFATLPQAFRPSHYLYLPIYTLGGGEGSLEISPGGAVSLFGSGNTRGYSSLAGVSYPLGS